ncbi:MAG: hypothetical protein ABW252_23890 [Polyangiales bacterium]
MAEPLAPLSDVVADPLVLGVVRGDRAAWFQLTLYVEAWVARMVPTHWRMRKARLARSEDDVRDVLLEVLERIDHDDFRALRQYLERKVASVPDVREGERAAQLSFASWLSGLVDYAIRDHVRKRYGRGPAQPTTPSDGDSAALLTLTKRDLHSWAVHPTRAQSGDFGGARPAVSRVLTARSILRYAAEAFDARELRVFERYLEQASFDELAAEFELAGPEAARAEVRRLKERLRAHFRG